MRFFTKSLVCSHAKSNQWEATTSRTSLSFSFVHVHFYFHRLFNCLLRPYPLEGVMCSLTLLRTVAQSPLVLARCETYLRKSATRDQHPKVHTTPTLDITEHELRSQMTSINLRLTNTTIMALILLEYHQAEACLHSSQHGTSPPSGISCRRFAAVLPRLGR